MAAGAAFPSLSSVKCWMGNASVGYVPGPPGFPVTSERNQRRPAQAPPCDHKDEYPIQSQERVPEKNRNVSGSYAWNSRTISAIQKGVYPSPLVSFHFPRSGTNPSPNSFESRPGFSPLTNYVTTTEQTWLTNIVYAPLM